MVMAAAVPAARLVPAAPLVPARLRVVVLLVGKTISPVVRGLMDQLDASPVQRMDETITVGQLLSIFCHGFREQVAHRVHFYRSGRLVSRGVLRVARTR